MVLILYAFAHQAHPDPLHLLTHIKGHAYADPVKWGELELIKLREAPDAIAHHVEAHRMKGIDGYLPVALFRCFDHNLVVVLTSD